MINRKKGNPETLREINRQRKKKTLDSIKEAINELRTFGYEPTITRIMEITKLSRAAFQQEHIKELLQEFKIGKYAKLKNVAYGKEINPDDYLKIHNKLVVKDKQIENQKSQIVKIKKELNSLNKENEILRMKIYELQLEKDILAPIKII